MTTVEILNIDVIFPRISVCSIEVSALDHVRQIEL